MSPDEAETAIVKATKNATIANEARIYEREWGTFSKPFLTVCADGNRYVVKALRTSRILNRAVFNDHVAAHLGVAMRAPVGVPSLVMVSQQFALTQANLSDLIPGIAHATVLIEQCGERDNAAVRMDPENRDRFVRLAGLYGWCGASDHQVIYKNIPPYLVHSVDHGHFFAGGPDWSIGSLASHAGVASIPDATLTLGAQLTPDEIRSAVDIVKSIGDFAVAAAIAAPPDFWGIPLVERVALMTYLIDRRDRMVWQT